VRYRHAWPGMLLLSALALLLTSLLLWGDHFLTPSPAGGIGGLLQLRVPLTVSFDALASPETARPLAEPATGPRTDIDVSFPASDRADSTLVDEAAHQEVASSATRPAAKAGHWPPVSQVRYALELGSFAVEEDAERAEAQLNQTGLSTVRFRQQTPARLYTVAIRQLARDQGGQGLGEGVDPEGVTRAAPVDPGDDGAAWVAKALPLRTAVLLAERLRSAGYDVLVMAEAAQVAQITLRHGNFVSRREAEAVSREISGLGVPNEVVTVR